MLLVRFNIWKMDFKDDKYKVSILSLRIITNRGILELDQRASQVENLRNILAN